MGHKSLETTKRYEHFAHEIIALENRLSHLDSYVYKIYYQILYLIFDYPHKHYTFKHFEV